MPTETIISLVLAAAALLFTAFSFRRTAFRDNGETATQRANLAADVRYIRTSVDEIKVENRIIQKDVSELKTRVATIEAAVDAAHKRIDDLRKEHEHD